MLFRSCMKMLFFHLGYILNRAIIFHLFFLLLLSSYCLLWRLLFLPGMLVLLVVMDGVVMYLFMQFLILSPQFVHINICSFQLSRKMLSIFLHVIFKYLFVFMPLTSYQLNLIIQPHLLHLKIWDLPIFINHLISNQLNLTLQSLHLPLPILHHMLILIHHLPILLHPQSLNLLLVDLYLFAMIDNILLVIIHIGVIIFYLLVLLLEDTVEVFV